MLVEKTHSFGALTRCAILFLFLIMGVSLYAQSFGSSSSYRIEGKVQSSYSAKQAASSSSSLSTTSQWQSVNQTYRQSSYVGTTVSEQPQYRSYSSTLYEPFTTGTPSDEGDDDYSGGDVDLDEWGDEADLADPGNQSNESPIGEPFILLLFAMVAAVVIRVRSRKPRTQD